MRLYKYCDEGGIQILKNCSIKVSSPSELNDPFDCKPVPDTWTPESVAALKNQITKSSEVGRALAAGLHPLRLPMATDLRDAKRQWEETLARTVGDHDEVTRYMDLTFAGVAILCLTALKNHHLMWAHYAKAHQGMVIELESEGVFRPPEEITVTDRLYRVEYAHDRPVFRFDQVSPGAFTTKGMEWVYEQEWRVLYFKEQFKAHHVNGRDLRLRPIPPQCIKAVYLGCRMSKEHRDEVIELVNQAHLKHMEVFEMKLDSRTFQVNEVPLRR